MAARRCTNCNLDFPAYDTFKDCLRCGEETWRGSNIEPMPKADLDALQAEVKAVQEASAGLNPQWLVVYYDQQGQNPNGEYRTEVFYATAYSAQEANELNRECMRRHGEKCGARAFLATGRPPKDGNPVAVTA